MALRVTHPGHGMLSAKDHCVINPDRCKLSPTHEGLFWPRLLSDEALERCENLEKLLAGCEIIAALDGLDLLAA